MKVMAYSFLIVDDEELSRNYITDLLIEFYPEARVVASVSNTTQARKILMEEEIDVMFLDIKMPGENGIEFLQSLKQNNTAKTIFITAYNDYTIQAIKTAAFDYLLKPIDKLEFKETINRLRKSIDAEQKPKDKDNATESYMDQKLTVHHSSGFRFITLLLLMVKVIVQGPEPDAG
jgi:two-component system LytT family response regulator